MTNFEKFKGMTLEEFAAWLDEYGQFDGSPWIEEFEESYCKDCESVKGKCMDREMNFSYCELNNKCRYFPDKDESPNNVDMITMWLKLEAER